MFSSLRIRLPLVFLGGILLAGVLTTLVAVRLFQDFSHEQTVNELRRQAVGIAWLYSSAYRDFYASSDRPGAPRFAAGALERATGDEIYWVGPNLFPGEQLELERLDLDLDWLSGESITFELVPPGFTQTHLAVAAPVMPVSQTPIGAIVVAKEKRDINKHVFALVRRLAIAGVLGLIIAGALALYLSRRLVRPIVGLTRAADEVAAGHYDTEIPRTGAGEIGRLTERFGEMAHRLAESEMRERNFLMSVSHELRTPLTAIRGHVSALLEGVVEDPDLGMISLRVVEAETNRLERLVGDILDLAKLDAHRFTVLREEVDMKQLVERAYEMFSDEARRRSIDYHVETRARPVIVSDGDRVLQIVGNLLSNAFRATPDGGRITLELDQQNGEIRVAVEDTGPGISAEQRKTLFRAFVSGVGGTGLGLTIAKELSTALGGRIELESEVGHGSRFELFLPGGSLAVHSEALVTADHS